MAGESMRVAACVRWVDVRPEIDLLTGQVTTDVRGGGFSAADQAAVEIALCLGQDWDATVDLVSVGGPEIEPALRDLGATGVDRIVRVDGGDVAGGLAGVLGAVDLVVCGDYSLDGGSGAVPALLAHELGTAQALGLVALEVGPPGVATGTRRLGGGRAERLRITTPAVISVEGSMATLRRAPLPALLAGAHRVVDVARGVVAGRQPTVVEVGPWRPRARALPPPSGDDPRDRIIALTGALVDRTPPRLVELEPEAAADAIVAQLRDWGYL
jgi:electron transfer flavoprotein beta subunit